MPSPVYGFAKPSPIKELLDKRKEEYEKQETDVQAVEKVTVAKPLKEATTNEVNENILEEKEPASTNQTVVTEHHAIIQPKELSTVNEPIIFEEEVLVEENDDKENLSSNVAVPQTTSFAMEFDEQVKEAVGQDQTVQQLSADQSEIHVKEMIVEQVQIENSTIHIGEVTVVQPSMDDQSPDTASREEKVEFHLMY